jgi:hypothetical protein
MKPGARTIKRRPSQAKRKRSRAERAVAERFLDVLKAGGDARVGKVRRVKQSVRRRSYENELKLSVAVERMVCQWASELS